MRKILLSLLTIIICTALSAQEYQKHEFSVGPILGLLSLDNSVSGAAKTKNKMSGGIGIGYTYFFKKNMGIATGLDFTFYNAETTIDNFSGSHSALEFDIDLHREFDFQYTISNYKENQYAFYLNIPIMLHYQFTDGEKVKFYGAGGVKVGLPINGKYKTSAEHLKTQGYFPHNGATIDDVEFRGFGDFIPRDYEDKISYKMAINLALEAGAKWKLSNEMDLYTGLFLDYGLNDVRKKESEDNLSLVQYNQINPENHIYNSMLYSSGEDSQPIISKTKTMGYGIKIRLAFGK